VSVRCCHDEECSVVVYNVDWYIRAYIANRVTDKLTRVTDKIYCCRSGSAADTQAIADIVAYELNVHQYVRCLVTVTLCNRADHYIFAL